MFVVFLLSIAALRFQTDLPASAPKIAEVYLTPPYQRLALVIGNDNYENGGNLKNSLNDARDMASALEELGFEVMKYENCDQTAMRQAIDSFGVRLEGYEVGLFYYAGHGLQVNGINYLIPVDANLRTEQHVKNKCVRADLVLGEMEASRTQFNILILDACRDNPFERSWDRGVERMGLASMNAPRGTLIAYATAPKTTASDGEGRNGLYTGAILEHIRKEGLTLDELFREVRKTVLRRSRNTQIPWESTSLTETFYFKPSQEMLSLNTSAAPPASFPYRTQVFNGLKWTTENLKEDVQDSWCYKNDLENGTKFGRLYTWQAAKRACASLGPGWRLPTDEEWKSLVDACGGYYDWQTRRDFGDPQKGYEALIEGSAIGFTVQLGGYRYTDGSSHFLGDYGSYWSDTENGEDHAWSYGVDRSTGKLYRYDDDKEVGRSCICVQE